MTKLEKLWHEFERRNLPSPDFPRARAAMTVAYHRGAMDMWDAMNDKPGTTPEEDAAYIDALDVYVLGVLHSMVK